MLEENSQQARTTAQESQKEGNCIASHDANTGNMQRYWRKCEKNPGLQKAKHLEFSAQEGSNARPEVPFQEGRGSNPGRSEVPIQEGRDRTEQGRGWRMKFQKATDWCTEPPSPSASSRSLPPPSLCPHQVLENMSCQGTTVGGRFEELHGIIERVADKARVGVCLDTCHAFAAGHDLSQQAGLQEMLKEFNQVVGLQYLKALHLNDSKGPLGCHLDRHQNIGRGHIGLEGFRHVMNEPRFDGLPLILETPATEEGNKDAEEIELLYSLCEEETEGHTQEEQKGTGAGDRK